MSGRSSQQKGRRSEIELSDILCGYGYDVRPGVPVSYGCEPDLVGLPRIHIEAKRVEKLNLSKAMDQAIRDSERFHDGFPTVFHRKNREPWMVTMRLDDWINIYREEAQDGRGSGSE